MFNTNIDFISKKKKIFRIDNFLDSKIINQIYKSFPEIDKNQLTLDKNFGKYGIKDDQIKGNHELQDFKNIIFSKLFFNFFTKKFFFTNAFSQNNLLRTIKYLRKPVRYDEKNYLTDFLFSKLKVSCQFSFIKNMGGIKPHVDSQTKYLSLMLYFPDKKYNDHEYGTTFWESKIQSHTGAHVVDDNELLNFKKNAKVLYKTPFISNVLWGFVRNNNSWHSVEPINIDDNYVRKSININFIYEN
jgi:hypothetical protein